MKKLALIVAAFTLVGASAHAETFKYGKNRVVIPSGCSSWSCISVSVPGHYSHNAKPERKTQSSSKIATTTSTATTTTTAATAPAQTNTAATTPSTSNVTVLPAPAATSTKY